MKWVYKLSFSLQMLGTGNAFSKKMYNNNGLIQRGEHKWLIDCGYLATRALHELKIPLNSLDGIFITHTHADHVGGLEEVAFRLHYEYNLRMKLYVPQLVIESLWEHTLKGALENKSEGMYHLTDYFDVIPIFEGTLLKIDDQLNFEIIRTLHVPEKPSYSFIIQQNVFYSSDMQFMPDFLINEIISKRNCKSILHDCHLLGHSGVHASLEQLLTLPTHIQSMTYLMHYGDLMEQYEGKTGKMQFLRQHEYYHFNNEGELTS